MGRAFYGLYVGAKKARFRARLCPFPRASLRARPCFRPFRAPARAARAFLAKNTIFLMSAQRGRALPCARSASAEAARGSAPLTPALGVSQRVPNSLAPSGRECVPCHYVKRYGLFFCPIKGTENSTRKYALLTSFPRLFSHTEFISHTINDRYSRVCVIQSLLYLRQTPTHFH